jgi:hypothetical protein
VGLIGEKNQRSKISCNCPFKVPISKTFSLECPFKLLIVNCKLLPNSNIKLSHHKGGYEIWEHTYIEISLCENVSALLNHAFCTCFKSNFQQIYPGNIRNIWRTNVLKIHIVPYTTLHYCKYVYLQLSSPLVM